MKKTLTLTLLLLALAGGLAAVTNNALEPPPTWSVELSRASGCGIRSFQACRITRCASR
ncbi:MAG TPA: hypothetical protein PKD86_13960 [Gemmatales bacterium]|nr:hypothetical protein [Gemmatales bacterium]